MKLPMISGLRNTTFTTTTTTAAAAAAVQQDGLALSVAEFQI